MAKRYKCPYCDERHEREKLIYHVEEEHEDLIPEHQTPTQVVFNSINKKDHGTCIVCKRPTKWNEKAGRYDRLCTNPRCKQKLRDDFKKNAMAKDGTYVYTADPKFQEKMLRGRKISSTYKFTDGGKVDYVGSYEKKFLEFIDKVMNIESKDIMAPGPTIPYEYNGKIHYWITDFYYVPGNLVLDIKDGGKNPNTRPMKEYREKQIAKENAIRKMKKYNYLRLTDNNFEQFMEVLADLKHMALDIKEKQLVTRINEDASIEEVTTVPPLYSSDASVLKAVDNETKEERLALSSLDFNDSILIDDPREGIKKVNKKYYKDNFETKVQFLYPKDESYYNLLKAYKENDPCIYEGIYANLSSFDVILTEDQIYFDDKFKLVDQLPLQEMQNKIKEVNDAILCIGESTLIRYDKLDFKTDTDMNIDSFYNELKTELESDGSFFMIKPSKDKEDLDRQFQKFNAQNGDQKHKADTRSFALYGMNNYDHYHILLSKIKKGTEDDELNGLEYDPHDEKIVKEDYDMHDLPKDFNCNNSKELDEKIDQAREFNQHTLGRVIIFPTQDANELESLFMKYMALSLDDRTSSDNKAKELFGKSNREIYKFIEDNIIHPKQDDIEDTHTLKKEVKTDSIFSNDTPLLTPEELSRLDEDYSYFSKEDGNVIKQWRDHYISLNEDGYRDLNIKRLNILRKAIYENNEDMIIQCGWIPNIEFNSENRVKASKFVKERILNERKIIKPKKCTKCGSTNIGVYLKGEPIFKCKDCGEYLGTVPFPVKESYLNEARSFPIQFDKDGNLIIKNIRKINFEQEYTNSHRLLMEYDKTKAYEPMKFELAKMQFFITLLEKKIYKQGKDKSKKELVVRARFLNDFKKYLKVITNNENTFNFGQYYEQSPFNDALIKIDNSTLKYGWKALKYMIK